MSISRARASRLSTGNPKEIDIYKLVDPNRHELKYPPWSTWRELVDILVSLPENVMWQITQCILVLLAILILSMDYVSSQKILGVPISELIDVTYNSLYALNSLGYMVNDCYRLHHTQEEISRKYWMWYMLDAATYIHYATRLMMDWFETNLEQIPYAIKMTCYYVRLRRPLQYLWIMNDYYMRGSTISTCLKYWYFFVLMRVIFTNVFIWMKMTKTINYIDAPDWLKNKRASVFYLTFYTTDKRFLPIGIDWASDTALHRLATVVVMMSGCLLVTGIACAALAIVISIHLRPEEMFYSRFRLIMDILKRDKAHSQLRKKVETYYKMYWQKQRAVSVTQLLPTYPPTLITTLYTDIYFELFQKSRVLRDLPYQFLSEISKYMRTINFCPGDTIIERNSNKSTIVFISYGEVEILTAEDNETPMLRFTRGTILNPCGACVEVATSPAHASVRAATFCVAHMLRTCDLWRVAALHSLNNLHSSNMIDSFHEHFGDVVEHYKYRPHQKNQDKSSILELKRNLIELKEAKDENGVPLMDDTDAFILIADCYIMRNQPNASLMDESDEICLKPSYPCVLQPSSSLQIVWKLLVGAMAVAAVFIHSYYIVFLRHSPVNFIFFDIIVNVVNILDIIVYLSTGTNIQEGVPVTFLEISSMQTRSFWFLLDVLSVVPVFYFLADGQFAGMNKVFKLPKVFRIMKELERVCVYGSHILRFFSVCLMMTVFCWLVATLNHAFLCFRYGYCYVTSFKKETFWSTQKGANKQYAEYDMMLFTMYWAVCIFTLNSHLTDTISKEMWQVQGVVMFLLEICAILHVVIESAYSAAMMVTNAMREEFNECIDTVNQFLERNYVDPVLRYRFVNYLQLCWYIDKAYGKLVSREKGTILYDLPGHVYQEIAVTHRIKYLLCIPFIKVLPPNTIKQLCSKLHLFHTSPNEILLNTGDMSNEVYVIKQGYCEVIDPKTKQVVSIISSKRHFSDLECLIRVPAYYTIHAVTHVQLYALSRRDLVKVIASPQIKEAIAYTKLLPEYHSIMKHKNEQFLKYQMPPPTPNRQIFPLLRKHESDDAYLLPFQRLGFFSILKYIFPRFTIRPDGQYLRRYERFRGLCAFLSAFTPSFPLLTLQFPWIYYLSWTLDWFAYLDVIQRMLVGYYDENGILIYHPASTASHYFRGAMIVDLMGCLPLEHLASINQYLYDQGQDKVRVMPKEMHLMIFNRCLQLYRLPGAMDFLDSYFKRRRDIILVAKTIPIFIVFINIVATFCTIFSLEQFKMVKTGAWAFEVVLSNENRSWIITDGDNVGYNITETPFNVWLTTFYWATNMLTTTGMGVFMPQCHTQIMIFVIGMILSMILITYTAVHVISLRSSVNRALADYQTNIKDITTFMNRERFHKDLQKEVLSYYAYTWEKTGGTDYRSVFKLCEQITLRTDAILEIYGRTFQKCPVLNQCELSLLRLLGRAVHSVYFCPDTEMIQRDDVISMLYFIDYGNVEVRDPEDDDHVVTELPRGSLFGNLKNVSRAVCPNAFVVNKYVHLLKLDAITFYKILQDFPSVRERMMQYRPDQENYIIGSRHSKSRTLSTWRQRAASSVILVAKKAGIFKFIHPYGRVMQIYLIIVCLSCVLLDVYNASFLHNSKYIIRMFYVLDVAFIPKVVLNILITYIESQGTDSLSTVKKHKKEYLLGEFKYDIFSLLPLEIFCLFFKNKWKVYPYLRLNRFFRTVTVHSCLTRYRRKLTINLSLITVASTLIWFTLFAHTTSCLWHVIGRFENFRKPKSSWHWNKTKKYVCFSSEYICAMYFVLTTFTQNGANDIMPRQQSEVAFVCMLMIVSTMMYMIYVGELSNIIHYEFNRLFNFYSKYLELLEFLKNNRVSHNLVTLTRKYTLHLWREGHGLQMPLLLKETPNCLRLKIMSAVYMKHLRLIPAFKHCEPIFLRHLVGKLEPFYYDENMYVVREGDITNSMYFVHRGRVQELIDARDIETEVYEAKTHFGTIQGLFRGRPYTYSYKTKIKSQVLTLSLDDWEYLLEHYPNNKHIINKYYAGPGSSKKKWDSKQHVNLESDTTIAKRQSKTGKDKSGSLKPFDEEIQRKKSELKRTTATDIKSLIDDNSLKQPKVIEKAKSPAEILLGRKSIKPGAEVESQKQTGSYPWPLYSRASSAPPRSFSDKDDTEMSEIQPSTTPIVKDLTKSSSETDLKKIPLTKSVQLLKPLLPPPGERPSTVESLTILHTDSDHIEPLAKKASLTGDDKSKDKTMSKKITMISKPKEFKISESAEEVGKEQLIEATKSASVIGLDERSLSSVSSQVSIEDDLKKVRISAIGKYKVKKKHSTLTFKDTITTFEDPKSDAERSEFPKSDTESGEYDNTSIQKEEEEEKLIKGVLSSMSVHSIGDVEGYMMKRSSIAKEKRSSKENK